MSKGARIFNMRRESGILSGVSEGDMRKAVIDAARGHRRKADVKAALADVDTFAGALHAALLDGTWRGRLGYSRMSKVGRNGKRRDILRPSFTTRCYQWLFLNVTRPIYARKDNGVGLNCKEGCGVTSNDPRRSVVRRVKGLFYDRREYGYIVLLDQRKCYAHIRESVFRRALWNLTDDRGWIDFCVGVTFHDGEFPIGTPASPFAHHVIMLAFDIWARGVTDWAIRYADNVMMAFRTREEAQAAKWRVKQWWWYTLGLRAKRHEARVVPLSQPVDFCGYVFHRVEGKGRTDHGKGWTAVRRSTVDAARRANWKSWPSYFGMLRHADTWRISREIEDKDMRLAALTEKIRIERRLDARHIDIRDLVGKPFDIRDYELRYKDGGRKEANWIKCLISMDETDDEGKPTGRVLAREFHGCYQYLVEFIMRAEAEYGKERLLPIEGAMVESQCGYIFSGSTNQLEYFDGEADRDKSTINQDWI